MPLPRQAQRSDISPPLQGQNIDLCPNNRLECDQMPLNVQLLGQRGISVPAWLLSAMRMLVGTPARAGLTGLGAGSLLPDFDFFGGDENGKPRRRRRRRALTASDRADIAFIAGLLGPAAGRQFATVVATRTT